MTDEDRHIAEVVARAPRMTAEQRDVLRRVFRYGGAREKIAVAPWPACNYCGKPLGARLPYVHGWEVPGSVPEDFDEQALFCGLGCGHAAKVGGVTKTVASHRPHGWS
jgi:hypothetical protein